MTGDRDSSGGLAGTLADTAGFARAALARFREERGLVVAASLSYTSLLALVPLIAISLSVLSAFPAFADVQSRLVEEALRFAAPHAGAEVRAYLDRFVANTGNLTALGIVWLAVTAIMLLGTIEAAFNAIWRVDSPRPLMLRLIAYWTTLTLGPLLFGAALSLSTIIFAQSDLASLGVELGFSLRGAVRLVPFGFVAVGLTVMYLALPHRRVDWRHALLGGVVGALLFEGLKYGFGYYVSRLGTFESVYGSLSALPAFLVWMYLVWAVVMFGAAVAAVRPEWLAARSSRIHAGPLTPARALLRALQVIELLQAAGRTGDGADNDALLAAAAGDGEALALVMSRLQGAGWVVRTDTDTAVLVGTPNSRTLFDLYQALGFTTGAIDAGQVAQAPWGERLASLMADASKARQSALSIPLDQLLAAKGPRLVSENSQEAGA